MRGMWRIEDSRKPSRHLTFSHLSRCMFSADAAGPSRRFFRLQLSLLSPRNSSRILNIMVRIAMGGGESTRLSIEEMGGTGRRDLRMKFVDFRQ
jgi:hypothetical protein